MRQTQDASHGMFSIGEFSKLTQLTVKTLRYYHEEGLLIPGFVVRRDYLRRNTLRAYSIASHKASTSSAVL